MPELKPAASRQIKRCLFAFQVWRGKDSDIDLIIELAHPLGFEFMQLADYLESKLGRKVDLITLDSFKRRAGDLRRAHIAKSILEALVYV